MRTLRRRPNDVSRDLVRLGAAAATPEEDGTVALLAQRRADLASSQLTVGNTLDPAGESYSISVGQASQSASAPVAKARLLYRLVRAAGQCKVLELGSAFGISGAHFVAGLQAGGGGEFVSIDAVGSRSALAAETIRGIVAPNVTVRLVIGMFEDHLHEMQDAQVVYIDGNHYAAPTLLYVESALAEGASSCLLILDDIAGYSAEMDEAWQSLARDSRFAFTGRTGDLGVLGVGDLGRRLSA